MAPRLPAAAGARPTPAGHGGAAAATPAGPDGAGRAGPGQAGWPACSPPARGPRRPGPPRRAARDQMGSGRPAGRPRRRHPQADGRALRRPSGPATWPGGSRSPPTTPARPGPCSPLPTPTGWRRPGAAGASSCALDRGCSPATRWPGGCRGRVDGRRRWASRSRSTDPDQPPRWPATARGARPAGLGPFAMTVDRVERWLGRWPARRAPAGARAGHRRAVDRVRRTGLAARLDRRRPGAAGPGGFCGPCRRAVARPVRRACAAPDDWLAPLSPGPPAGPTSSGSTCRRPAADVPRPSPAT